MTDLRMRLENLAAQATTDRLVPEADAVLRRGRRRHRRRLAGAGLLLAAVLTGAAVAPQALRTSAPSAGPPRPAAAAPSAPAGINRFTGGFWQDRIDATVFLRDGSDPIIRDAVARQLASLPEVEQVWFESRRQARERNRASFWDRPDLWGASPGLALPQSFRVRVRGGPAGVARLRGDLCGKRPTAPPCSQFVDSVVDQRAVLRPAMSGTAWTGRVDVSVFIDPTAPPAQVAAVGHELRATPGVVLVAFESRTAAIERVRALNPQADRLVDYAGRGGVPASYRVRVGDRAVVAGLRERWCRAVPDGHLSCTGGVLLVVDEAWLEGRQPTPPG